jgi:hypothetical protein
VKASGATLRATLRHSSGGRGAEGRLHGEVGQLEYDLLHTPVRGLADLQTKARAWGGDDPDFAEAIVRELKEFRVWRLLSALGLAPGLPRSQES